ncbi:acyl-CoA synthetase [Janthinobacterium sp. PC23-8]|uniref:acyl-CoA synthetase n=1 Tax=Janthinobacterium sp. PC23-8 TaxID=2012679 RepID=UPI000B968C76|nr:acyl-CoA synthetase [Janthinobacterium sp. PC23-8]OYO26304.1 hypothetical protein CD932_23950 [Janthinobacterium sp. PC23-8]
MAIDLNALQHVGTHAQRDPERPAIIMGASGETITYGQLDERSYKLAAFLSDQGYAPGDHIAIVMENSADYLIACWAAQRSGLYFTPVNWHLAADEIAYIIEDCDAKCVIASPTLATVLDACEARFPKVTLRLVSGAARPNYQSLAAVYGAAAPVAPLAQCEGMSMMYSSGTTGRPKGIKRPLSGAPMGTLGASDRIVGGLYQFDASVVLLCPAPLYHGAPLVWAMGALRLGACVVVMEKYEPVEVLRLVECYRVTHGHFVPTMFVRMLNLPEEVRNGYDLSSLKLVAHAAAPCPVAVKHRMFEWFGPVIHEYYAGSEGNGFCAVGPQEWLARPGTVGKAIFGQIHILDDAGEQLPAGEIGTVYFGGTPAFEYHNDAEKTLAVRNGKGWSTLGDYGYVDAEGYLFLSDRRTDLIISGGVNIYPRETEDVLQQHLAVLDVAVVGVPSAEFGEDVVAVVELKPGYEGNEALAAELISYCREHLSHFKCPRRVSFGTLPRTLTGKLLHRVVKEEQRRLQQSTKTDAYSC